MRTFHHIGLCTEEKQPNETYVPETKVWVTDPMEHPNLIEYLRYEPDSPVTGPMRELPHLAFTTDNLDREIEGKEVLLGPFEAMEGLRVVFILDEGVIWEYMEFAEGMQWGQKQ